MQDNLCNVRDISRTKGPTGRSIVVIKIGLSHEQSSPTAHYTSWHTRVASMRIMINTLCDAESFPIPVVIDEFSLPEHHDWLSRTATCLRGV